MNVKSIPNEMSAKFVDPAGRCELMRQYGDSAFPFVGHNSDGETVLVSIRPNQITVRTNQHNGWVRVNYYDERGLHAGETFDGRWV